MRLTYRGEDLNAEEVIDQFKKTGALLEGHFQLSSGLHSTVYLQCARVLQFPERRRRLDEAIAQQFAEKWNSSWLPRRRLAGS